MLKRSRALLGAAGVALAGMVAPMLREPHHMGRTRYTGGYKGHVSRYDPHQGDREIARRLRHAHRDANRQCDRAEAMGVTGGKVSRRGRVISILRIAKATPNA